MSFTTHTPIVRRTVTCTPTRTTEWVLTDKTPNPFECAQTIVIADAEWSTPILIDELMKAASYHVYRKVSFYDVAHLAMKWTGESFELNGCVFTKGETK